MFTSSSNDKHPEVIEYKGVTKAKGQKIKIHDFRNMSFHPSSSISKGNLIF